MAETASIVKDVYDFLELAGVVQSKNMALKYLEKARALESDNLGVRYLRMTALFAAQGYSVLGGMDWIKRAV